MNYSNPCNAGRCVGLIQPEHVRTAAGVCVCRCFCVTDIMRPVFINVRKGGLSQLGHRKAKP